MVPGSLWRGIEEARNSWVFTGLQVPPNVSFSRYKFFTTLPQFSTVLGQHFFDNPSCPSATVCMYVYSESVGQSLVFPLIAAGTRWAVILCLFFWLVLVLVLIVVHVPCIWITVVNYSVYVCDSDRFEFLSVSIRVLKHTFLLFLE